MTESNVKERAGFLKNLDKFSKNTGKKEGLPNEQECIRQVSNESGFTGGMAQSAVEPVQSKVETLNQSTVEPARQIVEPVKQQRRHRTGRNQQLNIKATDQTVQKFYRIADEANITLGEVLERALSALEEANIKKN